MELKDRNAVPFTSHIRVPAFITLLVALYVINRKNGYENSTSCKYRFTLHDRFNIQFHELRTVFHEISLVILTDVKSWGGGLDTKQSIRLNIKSDL
jgi:hypothetical protein